MRGPGTRRLAVVGLLTVLAVTVVALPGLSAIQNQDDPRNRTRGEGGGQDCLGCHAPMRDSHILQALFPSEIPVGRVVPFAVRVDNPWIHEVHTVTVLVDLSNATGLDPAGALRREEDLVVHHPVLRGELSNDEVADQLDDRAPPQSVTLRIPVAPQVVRLHGRLEVYAPAPELGQPPEVRAELMNTGKERVGNWTGDSVSPVREVAVPRSDLFGGDWLLRVTYQRGVHPTIAFAFNMTTVHGSPAGLLQVPPQAVHLKRAQGTELGFELFGAQRGTYRIEVGVRATVHYEHQTNQEDWDNFTRWRTVEVTVGDRLVGPLAAAKVAAPSGSGTVPVAEVLGIGSAVLLPPALVVGGTYGRSSRRWLNDALGGAKRRVLFHSWISFGLTILALGHVVLFFLEGLYPVTTGILWGGLGLVALLGLALTGYYQVPLIQRWGYAWWKGVHLSLGVLVLLFTAVHSLLDGSHFTDLEAQVPAWLSRLNL